MDSKIIDLYFERSEKAIQMTEEKYGKYCKSIALGILHSNEDAEECVNDTYLRVWNSVPPERPVNFKAYIAKIVRNLSLDRFFKNSAKKRSSFESTPFDEIRECLGDNGGLSVSDELLLRDAVNSFLEGLTRETRIIFMQRYWYFRSVKEIAHSLSIGESRVKVTLLRTRQKFKEHLQKEGIEI